jgi:ribosomal protein S8E
MPAQQGEYDMAGMSRAQIRRIAAEEQRQAEESRKRRKWNEDRDKAEQEVSALETQALLRAERGQHIPARALRQKAAALKRKFNL